MSKRGVRREGGGGWKWVFITPMKRMCKVRTMVDRSFAKRGCTGPPVTLPGSTAGFHVTMKNKVFFSTCNTKCSTVAWTNLCVADFISLNCRLKLFIVFHMSIKRTCSLEKYACSSSSRASSSSLALFQSAVSFWISRVSCWLAEVACSSWSRSMLLTCWRLALLKKVTHAWAGSGKEFSSSTSLHFLHKIQTCISNVIQKIQYTQSFTRKGCCFAKCCIYNHLRPSAQFSNQIIHVKVAWFQARQQTFPKCNQALRMFWKM